MQEEWKQVATPKVTFQVSILPKMFLKHVALTSSIIDIEVSSSEKAAEARVWRDPMMEKYAHCGINNLF